MGSMWIDEGDGRQYPLDPTVQPPPFDPSLIRPATQFPAAKWGGDFKALLALAEFARTNWWVSIQIDAPRPPGSQEMADELKLLVDLQVNVRPARLPEIFAQAEVFQVYLVAQLGIGARSHPNTYLLLKIAARAGELVMAALKMRYNRVRPSHVYPLLFPPMDVPDHSSYPSGHAVIGHLIAYAAIDAVPAMGSVPSDLALRIARNREVAGLHFPSDTAAGIDAAAQAFKILKETAWYRRILRAAKAEWI